MQGAGFRVQGVGCGVWGVVCRVNGVSLLAYDSGIRATGSWLTSHGFKGLEPR